MKHTILRITLLVLTATSAFAQIPQTMSYQGLLTDEAGNAVADGAYVLTFALYESAEGGTAIWQETQEVAAESGLFNVLLGRVEPLTLDFDHPFWLGITIGSDAELQPRIELASSPYSLQALSVADSAVTGKSIAAGHVVRSLNGARDEVTLTAGENISISAQGQELMISASGLPGTDGRNCWDLNGNGQGDPEEDTNGDGDFDAEDCKGAKGDPGSSGTSSWTDRTGKGVTTNVRVGVGTNNPSAKLDVVGNTELNGDVAINSDLDVGGGILYVDGSLSRVGIGTTVPLVKLHVFTSNFESTAVLAESDAGTGVVGSSNSDFSGGKFFSDSGIGVIGVNGDKSSFGGLFKGAENTGTIATVKISSRLSPSSSPQTMLLDGNEIDAVVDKSLFLNNNSSGDVVLARGGGSVRIGTGPDNDGSNAALEITSIGPGGGLQTMLLDGNEIDAKDATLFLNFNSGGDIVLARGGGDVVVNTTVVHSSDRHLKKNITTLDGALDKVLNLRGVSFEWKKVEGRNSHPQQGVQIGVVAQEVEAVVPELVKTDAEGYKSVAYANITALLIEAVKGQQELIKTLQQRIENLEAKAEMSSKIGNGKSETGIE